MDSTQKTSLLVPFQLPEYIRDDGNYANFVSFIQSYYQWMEKDGNVLNETKNLLSNQDIDNAPESFLNYYVNDFLPYFPKDTLIDQKKLIRFARELYQSKGTNTSYDFLFRVLYNSDFDMFNTKDVVFKASAGTWLIFKSLKLSTSDENFLNIQNYRIFGESTKTIATIENSVLAGTKIEVFISNMERLFQSGEHIRIVDNNNQDVYAYNNTIISYYNQKTDYSVGSYVTYNNTFYMSVVDTTGNLPTNTNFWTPVVIPAYTLRAKIVGQISQINVDPKHRGQFYKIGDPVVVYGGLDSPEGIGATAEIGSITTGGVKSIAVTNGGFGYREDPNTQIVFGNISPGAITPKAHVEELSPYLLPIITITNGGVGYQNNDIIYTKVNSNDYNFAYVTLVDSSGKIVDVSYNNAILANSVIGVSANVSSANANAHGAIITVASSVGSAISNVNYIPINTLSYAINSTVQIGNASHLNPYTFLSNHPNANCNSSLIDSLTFESFSTYPIASILVDDHGNGLRDVPTISALSTYLTDDTDYPAYLSSLGILGPIQIIQGGYGYMANDTILFSGGGGYGAYANVTSVDINGKIISISYVQGDIIYPLGGMGYNYGLPTLTVKSANNEAYGASIEVTDILGAGAKFSMVTDRAGSITTINIETYGEDYISTPNVSLSVQDIVVSGIIIDAFPTKGDFIYQGIAANLTSYQAYVDSVNLLIPDEIPSNSLYNLRLYNYTSIPDPNKPLNIDRIGNPIIITNNVPVGYESKYPVDSSLNIKGFRKYGDGSAKATAKFLNGLVIGQGQYLNTLGQPSSYNVLQNEVFNNYTYQITVNKEIAKYREIVYNLLHPAGTNLIGRYAMKSISNLNTISQSGLSVGYSLSHYTGYAGSTALLSTRVDKSSTNIITLNNLAGANIANFISPNSKIEIISPNGPNVSSYVASIDYTSNTITLNTSYWMSYSNVAYCDANIYSNVINITALTGTYDIINNGNYSNVANPLFDIIHANDFIYITSSTGNDLLTESGNNIVIEDATGNTNILIETIFFSVTRVDYANKLIYVTPNLISNISNGIVSVSKVFAPTTCVTIYGPVGTQYIPALTTEDGNILQTENNNTIILG